MTHDHVVLTTFLIEHPWLPPTGLGVLVVLGPLAGARLVRRPGLAWLLAAASLLPVALLTLWPVDREPFARCTVQWALPTLGGRVELLANVVLFICPALFAAVAARRPLMALVLGSGLSAALEALQALAPGLGRSCDTTDWLSNTIGAATGAGLAVVALALARSRREGPTPAVS